MDLQQLAVGARRADRTATAGLRRAVRAVAVRYCRARLGVPGHDVALADRLAGKVADEVTAAVLRQGELGDPAPVEAVVYDRMAAAVDEVLRGRDPGAVREGHRGEAADADGGADPDEDAGPLLDARRRLGQLDGRPREVLVLRALVGLTTEQVARALGTSRGIVLVEQHRALAHLRAAG